jgi:hypothetical protein
MKLRTSYALKEGGDRDFAISTTHLSGSNGSVEQIHWAQNDGTPPFASAAGHGGIAAGRARAAGDGVPLPGAVATRQHRRRARQSRQCRGAGLCDVSGRRVRGGRRAGAVKSLVVWASTRSGCAQSRSTGGSTRGRLRYEPRALSLSVLAHWIVTGASSRSREEKQDEQDDQDDPEQDIGFLSSRFLEVDTERRPTHRSHVAWSRNRSSRRRGRALRPGFPVSSTCG